MGQIFKKIETNISQTVSSLNSKSQSDALSNYFKIQNFQNNTRDVPLFLPTIQKSIPISTGYSSTKNNKTVGNET